MASVEDALVGISQFYGWLLLLYAVHRAAHRVAFLRRFHLDHHRNIALAGEPQRWHWSNLLLCNNTVKSTIDLWLTEVVPTFLFAAAFNAWWVAVFYYLWAAFLQESLEHSPRTDLCGFTFGKWHLIHHRNVKANFGLFVPFWDIMFGSNVPVEMGGRGLQRCTKQGEQHDYDKRSGR